MNLQNINPQHVIYLIIALIWVGGWVLKQAAAHKERQRRKQAQAQRELDMLRTGRLTPDAPTNFTERVETGEKFDPGRMLQEIGQKVETGKTDIEIRRQRTLEELRRRAAEKAQQAQRVPSRRADSTPSFPEVRQRESPRSAAPDASRGPTVPGPRGGAQRAPSRASRSGSGAPPQGALSPEEYNRLKRAQARSDQARDVARASPRPRSGPGSLADTGESTTRVRTQTEAAAVLQRAESRQPAVVARRHGTGHVKLLGGEIRTPEEWRRALAMQVILSQPAALRPPGEGFW